MKFTEEELRQAAVRVQKRHLAQLTPKEQCADTFSLSYAQQMQGLILQAKTGRIQAASLHMGWQYYARRGVAAVLLCFLLACLTMPEVVMAGYQTVIQVLKETILVEYTEYRYESTAAGDTKFTPLQLGYLPEGMIETDHEDYPTRIGRFYSNLEDDEIIQNKEGLRYIDINQTLLTENSACTYGVNTENAEIKKVLIQGEEVKFILKEGRITYIWLHGAYHITGQTNLPEDEVVKILENVEFGEKDFTPINSLSVDNVEKEMNYETIEPEYIYQYLLDRGVSEEKLNRLSFNTLESIFRQAEANQFTDIQVQQYIDGPISIMESPRNYSDEDEAVLSEDGGTFITSYGEVPNLMKRYHGKYTGEHPTEVENFYSE